ncbi:DUF5681 domain-containing protein [Paracoccus saliphilus]|uniref:DUF5681 domain-containing protein n=1 Tax=Paracoccus saliphilus TaxID=405559 RepID=A0AA45W4L8_9RHOB|nr:DUF5681 domain-containing protein [Paracoccus saliphilus]SIS86739.1 hypothetical protein SAMN05421772_10711 [Paracoccus saliphilus]
MTDRINGKKTGRNSDGTFAPGNPGRPRGARHKTTQAVEAMLQGEAAALTRRAIDAALEGDTTALRLCLERIAPARKDQSVEFDLPPMSGAEDAVKAAQSVLRAVSDGEITPLEGASIMGLIEGFRKTLETNDIEARIAILENSKT